MGHRVQPDKIVELLRQIIVLALFAGSCARPVPHPPPVSGPPSGSGDSLVIDSGAAVFFRQDSLRLERIKSILKDRVFESLSHDCLFEMKYARSVLQKSRPSLPIVNDSTHRWLIFVKKDGTRKRIDLYTIQDICGVILFDGTRDPERASMPDIDTALWNYFGEGRN